jgi:hypothetical protein
MPRLTAIALGFSPIRVIEEIDCLETEFQIRLMAEVELLGQGEVPVFDSRADHLAASAGAKGAVRGPGISSEEIQTASIAAGRHSAAS